MQTNNRSRDKLRELQGLISKLPLTACCSVVLPELGLRWKEVSRAVRNSRLPMQSNNVARVLCQYLAKSPPSDELHDTLSILRLKLVSLQARTWHVLHLREARGAARHAARLHEAPRAVRAALRDTHRAGMTPEVHSITSGDLLYLSVQLVSDARESPVLYVATPPAEPLALVSYMASDKILKACVTGLGYGSYESGELRGGDIPSLVRAARGAGPAPCLPPAYCPAPARSAAGIDYTHARYDRAYVACVVGPEPPLLTDLTIRTSSEFFNPALLDKGISLTVRLRSPSVAATLARWVDLRAITADSSFVTVITETRSNNITYNKHAADSD